MGSAVDELSLDTAADSTADEVGLKRLSAVVTDTSKVASDSAGDQSLLWVVLLLVWIGVLRHELLILLVLEELGDKWKLVKVVHLLGLLLAKLRLLVIPLAEKHLLSLLNHIELRVLSATRNC